MGGFSTGALQIVFDPALPWGVLGTAAFVLTGLLGFAMWRGLAGWAARSLAILVLLLALSGPSVQQEDRQVLNDILLVVVDETASQNLSVRSAQTSQALAQLTAQVAARPGLDMQIIRVSDAPEDRGTRLETAIIAALSDLPHDRIAGIIALSDGLVHDVGTLTGRDALPAPFHLLLTGKATDWDRRLVIKTAPAFAILGEEQTLVLRVENTGAVPPGTPEEVQISISVDGADPSVHLVPTGRDLQLPVMLSHGGINIIQLTLDAIEGELTPRNNTAILQINGVRDRLRVLLVSGQPHPGTRTWRNLLKSDASVDLVHFTILRSPEKQDGVPVSELSLIAFPTQELFLEKVDQFDLIIFDRYQLRGILPASYLANIRAYVEKGGAVLVAAGPSFATASSLARSPLGAILPAMPTSRVMEQAFVPKVTDLGQRHPVTQGLERVHENWGRWLRQIEVAPVSGHVVMQGVNGDPLLVLDRVGKGRVALLASDHAWLWSRGFEGGGPQLELLRRLAHWMMKEPELEEEALWAETQGDVLTIIRRSLGEDARAVDLTQPDGTVLTVPLVQTSPGRFEATVTGTQMGLYRLHDDQLDAVVAQGPTAPREFLETIATGQYLAPEIKGSNGGVFRLEAGIPVLRFVRSGRPAAGHGWLGLNQRIAYLTQDLHIIPLLPAWLALLFAALFSIWGWVREGRR